MKSRIVSLCLAMSCIATFEGLYLTQYNDPVGIPTQCFGHTAAVVAESRTIAECEDLLFDEAREYQRAVDELVTVPVTDGQLAAFTSFAYNVGVANFGGSTLLKKLNRGDYVGACNELPRWVYAKGVKLAGLERRRQEEKRLCLG